METGIVGLDHVISDTTTTNTEASHALSIPPALPSTTTSITSTPTVTSTDENVHTTTSAADAADTAAAIVAAIPTSIPATTTTTTTTTSTADTENTPRNTRRGRQRRSTEEGATPKKPKKLQPHQLLLQQQQRLSDMVLDATGQSIQIEAPPEAAIKMLHCVSGYYLTVDNSLLQTQKLIRLTSPIWWIRQLRNTRIQDITQVVHLMGALDGHIWQQIAHTVVEGNGVGTAIYELITVIYWFAVWSSIQTEGLIKVEASDHKKAKKFWTSGPDGLPYCIRKGGGRCFVVSVDERVQHYFNQNMDVLSNPMKEAYNPVSLQEFKALVGPHLMGTVPAQQLPPPKQNKPPPIQAPLNHGDGLIDMGAVAHGAFTGTHDDNHTVAQLQTVYQALAEVGADTSKMLMMQTAVQDILMLVGTAPEVPEDPKALPEFTSKYQHFLAALNAKAAALLTHKHNSS